MGGRAGKRRNRFAPGLELFIAGRILQGLGTGLLLVVVAPPIVNNFPSTRMPTTAATFLIGFFGATAAGPLIGGIVAQADAWRLFFGLLALIGILNLGLGLLTVDEQPPQNPERPIDVLGLALAAVGTVLAFYGSYDIETGNPSSPVAWTIAGIGLLALVALLVLEYRSDDPFIPVKPLSTSLPVLGVVCAMVSGAVFVALLELMETLFAQGRHLEPLASGLLVWPLTINTGLAAFVFWRLFTTKFIAIIPLAGMMSLALAALLIATTALAPASDPTSIPFIVALLGIGAGSTVAPSLFLAAFGVPSTRIGRTFALVELLRSAAAFLLGPAILGFALAAGRGGLPTAPVRLAPLLDLVHLGAWVLFGTTILTIVALVALFKTAGLVLRAPDLHAWIEEKQQALESPGVPPPSKAFTG